MAIGWLVSTSVNSIRSHELAGVVAELKLKTVAESKIHHGTEADMLHQLLGGGIFPWPLLLGADVGLSYS